MTNEKRIRILTYNVHSCIGTDRKVDPTRIASVIAQTQADIVALQEIDVRRLRTGRIDQASMIASLLKMEAHFNATLTFAEEQYGDAIITNWPTRAVKAGPLPSRGEPRGALAVEIVIGDVILNVVNTHLGLRGRDRIQQMTTLLGPPWLHGSVQPGATILCGDLNAVPASATYRLIGRLFKDVQLQGKDPARPTFPSRYPLMRLDHIFVSEDIHVMGSAVLQNKLTKVASDHLPLIADLILAS
ncbi:endonuclease/exonuclease/phosphatase family metal-dependent hydrolase [Rhizobium sp. ERR 922]|uniref:endonuclease/exonuclease/phosphatase family protein n=1 Tax=Rhizobium TaxID=379 RepID=UPI000DE01C43|nr:MULTISPECIES: endonuclease/exonuclease/phosphatase family protein [Rhizobium]TWB48463.1 endonuclease/exonuclease/phosphatase family metal-dependent hydrolase [Rhizobium sp. ERR 922]TWB90184.1 endonuclease/exonuclease/phosphatase family metal-dependent hydrolase [Rhizobium sp. ERR 942]GES41371.1 endonuclease [Rhizobium dioscoreae]